VEQDLGRLGIRLAFLRLQPRRHQFGAKIDALSQTAVIAGEIDGRKLELLPGMSGWATFGGGKRK
jgi:hypothetical protein